MDIDCSLLHGSTRQGGARIRSARFKLRVLDHEEGKNAVSTVADTLGSYGQGQGDI